MSKNKHIMIDLETMSTASNAAIISIGAVLFSEVEGIKAKFNRVISLKSSTEYGLVIEAATIKWWMQQSDEAREIFKANGYELPRALVDFTKWLDQIDCYPSATVLWGNGSDFDNVILTSAYKACNLPQPWMFYNNRCYRTVKQIGIKQGILIPSNGIKHNALDDACNQALHLIEISKANPSLGLLD